MYMRLTGTAVDCYKYLEPLYNDYRKVKSQNRNGGEVFKVNAWMFGMLLTSHLWTTTKLVSVITSFHFLKAK